MALVSFELYSAGNSARSHFSFNIFGVPLPDDVKRHQTPPSFPRSTMMKPIEQDEYGKKSRIYHWGQSGPRTADGPRTWQVWNRRCGRLARPRKNRLAAAKLCSEDIAAESLRCDVTKPEDHRAVRHYFEQRYGKLDILINNAAAHQHGFIRHPAGILRGEFLRSGGARLSPIKVNSIPAGSRPIWAVPTPIWKSPKEGKPARSSPPFRQTGRQAATFTWANRCPGKPHNL
jgi:Enoyl-(Acyl carrier protein) reductase